MAMEKMRGDMTKAKRRFIAQYASDWVISDRGSFTFSKFSKGLKKIAIIHSVTFL